MSHLQRINLVLAVFLIVMSVLIGGESRFVTLITLSLGSVCLWVGLGAFMPQEPRGES